MTFMYSDFCHAAPGPFSSPIKTTVVFQPDGSPQVDVEFGVSIIAIVMGVHRYIYSVGEATGC